MLISGIANGVGPIGQKRGRRAKAFVETTFTAIADNATKQEKDIKRSGAA